MLIGLIENQKPSRMSDWTCDANEALTVSLGTLANWKTSMTMWLISFVNVKNQVRARKDKDVLAREESYEGFNPTFTYPVRCWFGLLAFVVI